MCGAMNNRTKWTGSRLAERLEEQLAGEMSCAVFRSKPRSKE